MGKTHKKWQVSSEHVPPSDVVKMFISEACKSISEGHYPQFNCHMISFWPWQIHLNKWNDLISQRCMICWHNNLPANNIVNNQTSVALRWLLWRWLFPFPMAAKEFIRDLRLLLAEMSPRSFYRQNTAVGQLTWWRVHTERQLKMIC